MRSCGSFLHKKNCSSICTHNRKGEFISIYSLKNEVKKMVPCVFFYEGNYSDLFDSSSFKLTLDMSSSNRALLPSTTNWRKHLVYEDVIQYNKSYYISITFSYACEQFPKIRGLLLLSFTSNLLITTGLSPASISLANSSSVLHASRSSVPCIKTSDSFKVK